MENLTYLEKQIQERLSAVQAHTLQAQDATRHEMAERQLRSERFWAVASHMLDEIICPRMNILTALFPNARLTLADGVNTSVCVCSFDHTSEFPASTKLEIGMLPDLPNNAAIVNYSLEILPIFFEFDRGDRIVVPLGEVDEQAVSSWLDSKLLQFTDTYLRVRSIKQYQQENMVIDPVCGMAVNSATLQPRSSMPARRTIFASTTVGINSSRTQRDIWPIDSFWFQRATWQLTRVTINASWQSSPDNRDCCGVGLRRALGGTLPRSLSPVYHRLGWHGLMQISTMESSNEAVLSQQSGHAGHGGMSMPGVERPAEGESHTAHSNGTNGGATVWTCPMHPQFRSDRPGSCPICNMTLVPVDATGAGAEPSKLPGYSTVTIAPERQQLIGVRIGEVKRDKLLMSIRAVGIIEPDQRRLARIQTRVSGWVTKLVRRLRRQACEEG